MNYQSMPYTLTLTLERCAGHNSSVSEKWVGGYSFGCHEVV